MSLKKSSTSRAFHVHDTILFVIWKCSAWGFYHWAVALSPNVNATAHRSAWKKLLAFKYKSSFILLILYGTSMLKFSKQVAFTYSRYLKHGNKYCSTLTEGVMLSIEVLRLNTNVVPVAAPALLPTSTSTPSAGLRNLLVNSTLRSIFPLGPRVTWLPLGRMKSLASRPASMAW